jgi:hypothetical protein
VVTLERCFVLKKKAKKRRERGVRERFKSATLSSIFLSVIVLLALSMISPETPLGGLQADFKFTTNRVLVAANATGTLTPWKSNTTSPPISGVAGMLLGDTLLGVSPLIDLNGTYLVDFSINGEISYDEFKRLLISNNSTISSGKLNPMYIKLYLNITYTSENKTGVISYPPFTFASREKGCYELEYKGMIQYYNYYVNATFCYYYAGPTLEVINRESGVLEFELVTYEESGVVRTAKVSVPPEATYSVNLTQPVRTLETRSLHLNYYFYWVDVNDSQKVLVIYKNAHLIVLPISLLVYVAYMKPELLALCRRLRNALSLRV